MTHDTGSIKRTGGLLRSSWMRWFFGGNDSYSLLSSVGLLALRLHAGYTIMSAGMSKIPQPGWIADQVAGMGFPMPTVFAFAASLSEFIGGALLIVGLFTRPAAFFAAFTMGVAAFKFHGVTPVTGLHIAQLYFWIFLTLMMTGPGRISLDHLILKKSIGTSDRPGRRSVLLLVALPVMLLLAGTTIYRQVFIALPDTTTAEASIESVSVAGSFNDWDPQATPMQQDDGSGWSVVLDIADPGVIEFKFTANGGWEINAGLAEPAQATFPAVGAATLDSGGDTVNIKAYVPNPGPVRFTFDTETFAYTLKPAVAIEEG